MRTFFKHLIFLFAVLGTAMIVFEIIYTKVYEHAPPRNKTQYLLQLDSNPIDYVFLGSSRVENHIVTKLVESETEKKALNLGVQGGKLDDVYLMLKLLFDKNVRPEKVFVQVDYLFNNDSPSTIVGTESLPYIRTNATIEAHRKKEGDFWANRYVPFYRYAKNDFKLGFREFTNSFVGKKSKTDLTDGFNGLKGTLTNGKNVLPQTIMERNLSYEAIHSLCNANGVDVVYFCSPFCLETENLDYIDKLKQKIPELLDFSRSIADNENFQNCGHLNEKGALLFTQMLIDTCGLSMKKN